MDVLVSRPPGHCQQATAHSWLSALPQLRDQFYDSARILESGVGLRILGRPEAAAITEALDTLAHHRAGFGERIPAAQQAAMRNLGGITRAKELLQREVEALEHVIL